MKKYVFSDTFEHDLIFYTMANRGKSLSPWWSHFEKVDGDFRLVRCLHCNKLVRRGKEGCSTREASNSGMASHMRTKHSGQAVQVVFLLLLWNLKTSSLRFKLDLMPPRRLVGRSMLTRRTKRLGEVCHSSSCDRRQIERHGENWYFLIVTWLESEAKYFYSRHFLIKKTSKWVPSVASTRSIVR